MIRPFFAGLVAASLLASPAIAQVRPGDSTTQATSPSGDAPGTPARPRVRKKSNFFQAFGLPFLLIGAGGGAAIAATSGSDSEQ